MKKLCLTLAGIVLTSLIFSACSSNKELTKIESKKTGSYVGQYDENMTPENSCVICIRMRHYEAGNVTFKQINPKMEADEQSFHYGSDEVIIFKPCKPGAKYMVTKAKGGYDDGVMWIGWDFELKPNQQYYVVEAPKKPGLYFFDDDSIFLLGLFTSDMYDKIDLTDPANTSIFPHWKRLADARFTKGNIGLELTDRRPEKAEEDINRRLQKEHYGYVYTDVYNWYKSLKKLNQNFAECYAGTPWYDIFYEYAKKEKEYLDKASEVLEDYKKNNHVPPFACCN